MNQNILGAIKYTKTNNIKMDDLEIRDIKYNEDDNTFILIFKK